MLDAFIEMIVHLFAWIGVNLSIKADEVKNKHTLDVIKETDELVKELREDYYKKQEEDMKRKYGD